MLIPAHYHLFDPADQLVFGKITHYFNLNTNVSSTARFKAAVLEIDQPLYTDFFSGTSPLPRPQLGTLLKKLLTSSAFGPPNSAASKRPLIIDLDISPRGEILDQFDQYLNAHEDQYLGPRKKEDGCLSPPGDHFQVEDALCSATTNGTPVVLLVPFATSPQAAIKKYRWMRFICEHTSADFGFGDVPVSFDVTAPYYKDSKGSQQKLLAHVAKHYASASGEKPHGLCAEIKNQTLTKDLPTTFAFLDRAIWEVTSTTDGAIPTLKADLERGATKSQLLNMNGDVLSIPLSEVLCQSGKCSANDMRPLEQLLAEMRPHTPLLLGGTWDTGGTDIFDTGAGRAAGVYLHAFAAIDHFLDKKSHWIIVLAEIPIGLAMIYIFSFLWECTDRCLQDIDDGIYSGNTLLQSAGASLAYLCVFSVIPITGLLLAFGIILAVALLFSISVWVTPSALLISILLKTYLERNAGRQYNRAGKSPYRSWYVRTLAQLPLILLLAWAFGIFIMDIVGEHHA